MCGVILDETHGQPWGSIAIYGTDNRFVNKDTFRKHCRLSTTHGVLKNDHA